MSQTVTQNITSDLVVILTKDNTPVTGVLFSEIVVEYRKEGQNSFTTKAIVTTDFVEIGSGVYTVSFTASELNTLGTFVFKVTSSKTDQYVGIVSVVEATQPITNLSISTCVLTGHIVNAQGNPIIGAAVSARVTGMPSIEQYQAAVTDDMVTTKTNVAGEFFLELIRLADVEVFIPEANYRRRLKVPNSATANLFTEVP